MKAIVIGGTGATGKELVKQLLDDSRFEEVTALVRRPYFGGHIKLKEIIVDFEKLEEYKDHIEGNVAFSCLGTTLKDAGGKEAQWQVDHDYQLKFAALAKENGIRSFVLLSATGADSKSLIFYNKMKGTLEENIQALGFDQFLTLHPGAIDRPNTTRAGEKWMTKIISSLNTIGILKSYAVISTARLAQAMIASYFTFTEVYKIVSLKEIKDITKKKENTP